MSAFLLCAGTVRQKEEKRTEKKFRRTGLLERHSPGGLGVSATYTAALVLTKKDRGFRQRRLRDPAVFIRGSQSRMQKARRLGKARRCRLKLCSCGAAFCLSVGVDSQICREPSYSVWGSRQSPGGQGGARTPEPPSYPANRRISGNGVEPSELPVAAGLSYKPLRFWGGGYRSPPGFPSRRRTFGLPRQERAALPRASRTGGQKLPGSAGPKSIAASLPKPASLLHPTLRDGNEYGKVPEPAPGVHPGFPRVSDRKSCRIGGSYPLTSLCPA